MVPPNRGIASDTLQKSDGFEVVNDDRGDRLDERIFDKALFYQFETRDIAAVLSQQTWRDLQRRLDGPEVDIYQQRRPEVYMGAWHSASSEIALNDQVWQAIAEKPEGEIAELYGHDGRRLPALGHLTEWAAIRYHQLWMQLKVSFLFTGDCTEELRCRLWAALARNHCFSEALQLYRQDVGMTSKELSGILKRHDSVPAMRDYTAEQCRIRQADLRNYVLSGGVV